MDTYEKPLVLFMMLGAVKGFAADGEAMPVQTPPAVAKPKMIKVGDDYYLDFQNGRVAGFFQVIGKVKDFMKSESVATQAKQASKKHFRHRQTTSLQSISSARTILASQEF